METLFSINQGLEYRNTKQVSTNIRIWRIGHGLKKEEKTS